MESSLKYYFLNIFLYPPLPPPTHTHTHKHKKPIVFARTKLSISNEERYFARSKQSHEFHKRNKLMYEHKLFEFIWIIIRNS